MKLTMYNKRSIKSITNELHELRGYCDSISQLEALACAIKILEFASQARDYEQLFRKNTDNSKSKG